MTEKQRTIKFKWENGKYFEMTEKEGDGETLTIIRVEENSNIAALWGNIAAICTNYLMKVIKVAGDEMKS